MAKVFLVDDDHDIVAQNRAILEAKGYEVFSANSAKEASEKLVEINPDVMVLDVIMENRNAGLDFARKISTDSTLPNVPIILLTSDGQNPNWLSNDSFTWNRIVKFLDKPVPPALLLEVVENLMV